MLYLLCIGPCTEDEFRCPDDEFLSCFPNTYLCDSFTDCDDGFDEQNCSTSENIPQYYE